MEKRRTPQEMGRNQEGQPPAKRRRLSTEAKQEIIEQCRGGDTQVEVAKRYRVTKSCVSRKAEPMAETWLEVLLPRLVLDVPGNSPSTMSRHSQTLQKKNRLGQQGRIQKSFSKKPRSAFAAGLSCGIWRQEMCASDVPQRNRSWQHATWNYVLHGHVPTPFGQKRTGHRSSSLTRQPSIFVQIAPTATVIAHQNKGSTKTSYHGLWSIQENWWCGMLWKRKGRGYALCYGYY